MGFIVRHQYINQRFRSVVRREGNRFIIRGHAKGEFDLRHPGRLEVHVAGLYTVRTVIEPEPGPDGQPFPKRPKTERREFPLVVSITKPNGLPFTGDVVTLGDLLAFRDARGDLHGTWTFEIEGETSEPAFDEEVFVSSRDSPLVIHLVETVNSKSAPPLVDERLDERELRRFSFDLFRVGVFTASALARAKLFSAVPERPMRLLDPDGTIVASSSTGRLSHPVPLDTLGRSRDAQGNVRPWTLEVGPSPRPRDGKQSPVSATVVETARVEVGALQSRIDKLIGEKGSNLSVFVDETEGGEGDDAKVRVRLEILDRFSAETIDMHDLLDKVVHEEEQEGRDPEDLSAPTRFTLKSFDQSFASGKVRVKNRGFRVTSMTVTVGASQRIQPAVPCLRVTLETEGSIEVEALGIRVGTARIRDNRVEMEAGFRFDGVDSFAPATFLSEDPLDLDFDFNAKSIAVLAALTAIGLGLPALAVVEAGVELAESALNQAIVGGLHRVMESVAVQVPRTLAIVLGDAFTFRNVRLSGDDILFDYVAPTEPEPKPAEGYTGIIGRSATQTGPNAFRLVPRSLGDTWLAPNLQSKIKHVVVVMMENRSYDHVLGYLARSGVASDGLTDELVSFLDGLDSMQETEKHPALHVTELRDTSAIARNGVGLRTKFPFAVGHRFGDVTEQLAERVASPSGRVLNSPRGFLDNFAKKLKSRPFPVDAVLGYHVAEDLPFTRFLTEHYGFSDRYFCSHPGPTLPNRMYSLTGDLQFDRTGTPIFDNNDRDNFFLSRATSIFDLLTRMGVGWRIYESFPSVTMLRMFARYATDTANIVDVSRLRQDVLDGDLPAFTMVEPAMHHFPESDDHPTADMYQGQRFLQSVYDALRSNDTVWGETLLIVTYDEHGGFYDHVPPLLAEARVRPPSAALPTSVTSTKSPVPQSVMTGYGVRVPTFVVSPWVPAGKGPDVVLDHASILKTVLACFLGDRRPFLSDRVHASHSFDSFLSAPSPRMDIPSLGALPVLPETLGNRARRIETPPISRAQMRLGNVDYHDLTGMLARMLGR